MPARAEPEGAGGAEGAEGASQEPGLHRAPGSVAPGSRVSVLFRRRDLGDWAQWLHGQEGLWVH